MMLGAIKQRKAVNNQHLLKITDENTIKCFTNKAVKCFQEKKKKKKTAMRSCFQISANKTGICLWRKL